MVRLARGLAPLVSGGDILALVIPFRPDREAGDVMRDAVEAQRRLLAADFHGLARVGVHAAGESDRAAELLELVGGHPGVRRLAVIVQQRVQAAAIAVVRDAVAQDVLDEVHLVREQVARLAGAVQPNNNANARSAARSRESSARARARGSSSPP